MNTTATTTPPVIDQPPLEDYTPENQKEPILIVGRGIYGAMIAWEFANLGYQVRVVDMNPKDMTKFGGASGVLPERMHGTRYMGKDELPIRWTIESTDFYEQHACLKSCDYLTYNNAGVAPDPEEIVFQQSLGINTEIVQPEPAKKKWPFLEGAPNLSPVTVQYGMHRDPDKHGAAVINTEKFAQSFFPEFYDHPNIEVIHDTMVTGFERDENGIKTYTLGKIQRKRNGTPRKDKDGRYILDRMEPIQAEMHVFTGNAGRFLYQEERKKTHVSPVYTFELKLRDDLSQEEIDQLSCLLPRDYGAIYQSKFFRTGYEDQYIDAIPFLSDLSKLATEERNELAGNFLRHILRDGLTDAFQQDAYNAGKEEDRVYNRLFPDKPHILSKKEALQKGSFHTIEAPYYFAMPAQREDGLYLTFSLLDTKAHDPDNKPTKETQHLRSKKLTPEELEDKYRSIARYIYSTVPSLRASLHPDETDRQDKVYTWVNTKGILILYLTSRFVMSMQKAQVLPYHITMLLCQSKRKHRVGNIWSPWLTRVLNALTRVPKIWCNGFWGKRQNG